MGSGGTSGIARLLLLLLLLLENVTDLRSDDQAKILAYEATKFILVGIHLVADAIVGLINTCQLLIDTSVKFIGLIGVLYQGVNGGAEVGDTAVE